MTLLTNENTIAPNDDDRELARAATSQLARLLETGNKVGVLVLEEGKADILVELPVSASRLLVGVLKELARGNALTVLPRHSDLTTQQAADFLNVSRPYLVKLLESDEIPFHKVGTHRRVRLEDVLAYKRQIDEAREESLRKLAAYSQELELDDLDRE